MLVLLHKKDPLNWNCTLGKVKLTGAALPYLMLSALLSGCTGMGETKALRMRRLQERAAPTASPPCPSVHRAACTLLSHTWAIMRPVSGYLSGDVGVCPRRGAGWLSMSSWIVQEVPDENCVIM